MISKRSDEAEAPARVAEAGGAGRKPRTKRGGAELGTAISGRTKSEDHKLMEEVVERSNLQLAYQRVVQNKGAPGVDDVSVAEFKDWLKMHWPSVKKALLEGRYIPRAVRRVDIPKPSGGMRTLGVPTVVDRLIQQALHQVLQPLFEPTFSDASFGFRPGRGAHQAVRKAQGYIREGTTQRRVAMTLNNKIVHSSSICHMDVATDEVREASRSRASDSPSSSEGRSPNGSTRRRIRGLLLRNGVWHIDKVLFGKRICESTHISDLAEAEMLLAHRTAKARMVHLYGEPAEHIFREAAVKFLAENQHKRSIERDARALKVLDPFIGSLPLKRVHQGTLEPYIRWRREKGNVGGTINREVAVVKRILNPASRYWRDESDQPWIAVAPMLPRLRQLHQREPYPLSVAEQRLLFSELKGHLKTMALFKVNTGLRQAEVANLRWEWEVDIPELGASIFVIPREHTKLELDRYVVLNRIARSIVDSRRGEHPQFVFTYRGKPVEKIYNSSWKAARRRAAERYPREIGRPCPKGFRAIRVHDLKHAFGHRLRGAGVSFEDRKVLLGHKTHDVTTHYSAAEIGLLVAATERVCELAERASPAVAVVRSSQPEGVRHRLPTALGKGRGSE